MERWLYVSHFCYICRNLEHMKRILVLMLALASMVCMVSCTKESGSTNPLAGTLWSVEDVTVLGKNEYTRYIEFVDDTTVKVWDTDNNQTHTGTYTVNGNSVKFKNLYDDYWWWYYLEGTFTSKSLTVTYAYHDANGSKHSVTYTKE